MSIDNLITLLLFIVFIVVPMLSRSGRKGPQGRRPGAPNRPGQKPQTRGQSNPQTGQAQPGQGPQGGQVTLGRPQSAPQQAGGQAPVPSMSDDFNKRLEEARRRVQEAMDGQTTSGRAPEQPQGAPVGQESGGDMFRPQSSPATPPRQAPQGLMGQKLESTKPRSPAKFTGRSGQFAAPEARTSFKALDKRGKGAVTKPLQVQRSLGSKRAKLRGRLLSFSETDLMRGIVWKQILDEPRSKQSWRQQSQRR